MIGVCTAVNRSTRCKLSPLAANFLLVHLGALMKLTIDLQVARQCVVRASMKPEAAGAAARAVSTAAAAVEAPVESASAAKLSPVEMWNGNKRLQTQVLPLAQNTIAIRSLDYDRDRFDIEFG